MNKVVNTQKQPFFITTAIPYVNAAPHIGFALELVQADAVARWQRLKGKNVRFLTGTDENSLKNVQAAEREGLPVAELVQRNAARFAGLKETLALSFDDFIRTSADERHGPAVRRIWEACEPNGDLYKKHYSGLYCVGCEHFYNQSELKDGVCPDHLTVPELVEEENYFFRLSRYEDRLLDLIETDKLEILPHSRKAEVVSFIRAGLADFSVSRSCLRARGWGLPVPGDSDQVIYVWFDALVNYISDLGYADDSSLFQTHWNDKAETVHVIGKGVTRFHAVYWPAILLSAGLPLPKQLFVHGYVTANGAKISKSTGNAVDPADVAARFGCDSLRYFLLRDVPSDRDGDFTEQRLIARHNADLVGKLGNLLNRTVTLINRDCDGKVPSPGELHAHDQALVDVVSTLADRVDSAIKRFRPDAALDEIFDAVVLANKYITDEAPWNLAKVVRAADSAAVDIAKAKDRLQTVLHVLSECLRIFACCSAAFLPQSAEALAKQIGVNVTHEDWASQTEWNPSTAGTPVQSVALLFQKL